MDGRWTMLLKCVPRLSRFVSPTYCKLPAAAARMCAFYSVTFIIHTPCPNVHGGPSHVGLCRRRCHRSVSRHGVFTSVRLHLSHSGCVLGGGRGRCVRVSLGGAGGEVSTLGISPSKFVRSCQCAGRPFVQRVVMGSCELDLLVAGHPQGQNPLPMAGVPASAACEGKGRAASVRGRRCYASASLARALTRRWRSSSPPCHGRLETARVWSGLRHNISSSGPLWPPSVAAWRLYSSEGGASCLRKNLRHSGRPASRPPAFLLVLVAAYVSAHQLLFPLTPATTGIDVDRLALVFAAIRFGFDVLSRAPPEWQAQQRQIAE